MTRSSSAPTRTTPTALAKLPASTRSDPQVQSVIASAQGKLVVDLSQRYLEDTPPAEIRFNVNPFVIWFWLGAIIAIGGALFAIWPSPEGKRRRVTDIYGARLARELSRAPSVN